MSVGIYGTVVCNYLKEMLPNTYFGVGMAVNEICWVIGKFSPTILANLLGPPEDPDSVFMMKVILGFPIIFLILTEFLFVFIFNDRTPKFAMSLNKPEEARKALSKIYKKHVIEDKLETLRKELD